MTIGLPYNRVSSDRQANEGNGIKSQDKRGRDYIEQQGYVYGRSFNEEGVSGGIIERPAMQELLQFLDEHKDDGNDYVVVIDDIKRLARDVQGHFTLKTAIYSRGARIESPNHKFEDTPEGKFIETVLAGAAELERNQNTRQVVQKMKARLESGYWPFYPPKALINKPHPIHKRILISNEPYASIFKKAIEQYRDGLLQRPEDVKLFVDKEYEKIGLNEEISLTAAHDMLTQILYTGYLEYADWNIPLMKAKHEGFISLETYNAVQDRLQGRTKPWKRRDYNDDFPLRPLVLCAACKTPMTASWNTGRHGKKYPNYLCRKKGCIYNYKVINKYKFEEKFEIFLGTKKPADYLLDLTKDVLLEQWNIRLEQYTEKRSSMQHELEEAVSEKKTYVKLLGRAKDEELISEYEDEVKELKAREKELTKKLAKKKYTSEEFGTATKKVFDVLKQPQKMWKSDDYNDKRTILLMYFDDQLQYDYKLGFGTAGSAYPINVIAEIGQAKNGGVEMSGCDPESEKSK